MLGSEHASELAGDEADGTSTENQYTIALMNPTLPKGVPYLHVEHSSFLERNGIGDAIDVSFRHSQIILASPVSIYAQLEPIWTELAAALPAQITGTAANDGVDGDAITGTNALHIATNFNDLTGDFMPKDHGRVGARKRTLQDVDVCAANPHRSDLDQHFILRGRNARSVRMLELDAF